jgi:RHS repeat-associated protein
VGGQQTRFLIDTVQPFAQVVLEYRPSGVITASYIDGHGLISQTRDGAKVFHHVDGLGSTRALTDSAGAVSNRYMYDAFGSLLNQTGVTSNSYLFAGQQRDASLGLDYLRARYYDPATGRFVSRDAFPGFEEQPLSLNKYLYALANPVNRTDPSGNFTLVEIDVAQAVQQELKIRDYVNKAREIDKAVQAAFKVLQGIGAAMTAFTALEGLSSPTRIGHFFGGLAFNSSQLFEDLENGANAVRAIPALGKIAISMVRSRINYIFEPASPLSDAYAWVYARRDQETVFYAPPFVALPAFASPSAPLRNCMTAVIVHEFAHLSSRGEITDIRGRNSYGRPALRFPSNEALKNAENYMLAVQATIVGLDAEQALFNFHY